MKTIADQSYYLSKTFEYVLLSLTVIERKRKKWGLITVTIFRAALAWRVPYLPPRKQLLFTLFLSICKQCWGIREKSYFKGILLLTFVKLFGCLEIKKSKVRSIIIAFVAFKPIIKVTKYFP